MSADSGSVAAAEPQPQPKTAGREAEDGWDRAEQRALERPAPGEVGDDAFAGFSDRVESWLVWPTSHNADPCPAQYINTVITHSNVQCAYAGQ